MTNQTNHNSYEMSLRRLSFGITAAVLAVACGSDDNNNPAGGKPEAPVDVPPVKRETCDDNPLLAGCPGNTPSAAVDNGAKPDTSDPAALAKASAENVLASNCGQCHGPNLTPAAAKAGMNYINDIDRLVQTGKIVPLNSAGSLIVQ